MHHLDPFLLHCCCIAWGFAWPLTSHQCGYPQAQTRSTGGTWLIPQTKPGCLGMGSLNRQGSCQRCSTQSEGQRHWQSKETFQAKQLEPSWGHVFWTCLNVAQGWFVDVKISQQCIYPNLSVHPVRKNTKTHLFHLPWRLAPTIGLEATLLNSWQALEPRETMGPLGQSNGCGSSDVMWLIIWNLKLSTVSFRWNLLQPFSNDLLPGTTLYSGSWWNKNSKAQTSTGGKELCAQRTWGLRVAAWRGTSVLSKRSWVAVVKLETCLGCFGSVVVQYLIRRRIRIIVYNTCSKYLIYKYQSSISDFHLRKK